MAQQELRKNDLVAVSLKEGDSLHSAELWLWKMIGETDQEGRHIVFEAKPLWTKQGFWLYDLPYKPFAYWVMYFWNLGKLCIVESEYMTPERVLEIGEDLAKWQAIAVKMRDL